MTQSLIGQTLGAYRILEKIGRGGMATVYKAYQPALDRYVAVKVLPSHLADEPGFAERFQREAHAVAKLEHPHILAVYDFGQDGDLSYLVMRYVEPGTLKGLMGKPMEPWRISELVNQIADALDHAHELGIVHRDVKPANVLLDRGDWTLLTDFGLARMMEISQQITASGVGLGTPHYMSPEQGMAKKVDQRSDVYSLGVVVYEMLTGRVPFDAETPLAVVLKHINDPLPLPSEVRPEVPDSVERVVLRAMAKDPDDRFLAAGQLASSLREAVSEAGSTHDRMVAIGDLPTEKIREEGPLSSSWFSRMRRFWWLLPTGLLIALFGFVFIKPSPRIQPLGGAEDVISEQASGSTSQATLPSELPPSVEPSTAVASASIAPVPTMTSADVSTATPLPLEQGFIVRECGNDLCVSQFGGGQTAMGLAADYSDIFGFSWAPDGERVTFSACTVEKATRVPPGDYCRYDLFLVNRDGSNLTALVVSDGRNDNRPVWSPDGEWIAFHDASGLTIVRPDTLVERTLIPGSGTTCPIAVAWSPDSQRVAWLGGDCFEWSSVLLVNVDGGGSQSIFKPTSPQDPIGADLLAWTPDGQSVIVKLEDGTYHLIDANCNLAPRGCDGTSRTSAEGIPLEWMPTFHPQWAGQADIPQPPEAAPTIYDDFELSGAVNPIRWLSDTDFRVENGVAVLQAPTGKVWSYKANLSPRNLWTPQTSGESRFAVQTRMRVGSSVSGAPSGGFTQFQLTGPTFEPEGLWLFALGYVFESGFIAYECAGARYVWENPGPPLYSQTFGFPDFDEWHEFKISIEETSEADILVFAAYIDGSEVCNWVPPTEWQESTAEGQTFSFLLANHWTGPWAPEQAFLAYYDDVEVEPSN